MATKQVLVKFQCKECKRFNYHQRKGGKKGDDKKKKLELSKFCKWCRKHTMHKETKK